MAKTHKLKSVHVKKGNMTANVDLGRIERNLNDAQLALDTEVMRSMTPFMPMQTGTFINVTEQMSKAIAGSGKVVAAAPPTGRYLYEGKTMVDEKTGSPWARKGAKKVIVSQFGGKTAAREDLQYSQHGKTRVTDHWFDAAKKQHLNDWINTVKKEIDK